MNSHARRGLLCSAAIFCALGASNAQAADAAAATTATAGANSTTLVDEVVVSARRRAERPIDAPVVENAFTGAQLERAEVHNLTDVANMTPQLTIERNVGTFGGTLTLRGVASPSSNQVSDSAVTVNFDGVPI